MKAPLALAIFLFSLNASASDLYSDDWVKGMARMEIDPAKSAIDLRQPILDVVPNGQTLKISKIFERLDIDPKRVVSRGSESVMNVTFFEWQISDSYVLSIMVGSQRIHSDLKESDKLELPGYGVRIFRIATK